MRTTPRLIAGLLSMGLLSFGSTINTITFSNGVTSAVAVSTFDAFGNNMGPMAIVVNFGNGSATCNWIAADAGCSVADQFAIGFAPAAGQTFPQADPTGYWFIDDLRAPLSGSNNDILSVTINALVGNVALDRCMSAPGVFNNNNNTLFADCDAEGTAGSNLGWTANDGPGGNNIIANAAYTDRLHTATQDIGDLYGSVTLNFDQGGTHFDPGERFTWRMDTDLLTAQVPEPATLGMVGAVLMFVGLIRLGKKPN